ncbi:sigma-70 family RNA polymerase sigma factor [Saccharothrix longispora]|uniref:sigma-70 family RNA polymerase sigma factor n=1 Tax=Saccharothrix longispora TaxID=33920 RepID=UPI0028FD4C3D|nr:sigma-70 family RNA polymerase sigma factor [Saccharothrix longispora]MDU0294746.1 sigma-70 family RNA polymerase sigma factor [Saccharothrix longispora]
MTGGGERSGGVPPRRVTRLQPDDRAGARAADDPAATAGDCVEDGILEEDFEQGDPDAHEAAALLAEFGQDESEPEFDDEERDEADTAVHRVRYLRREQDRVLYEEFVVAGFRGAKYEIFRGELAGYALPVIRAWLRRGLIFDFAYRQGRPLKVTEHDRAGLEDVDERIGLAHETVAKGLSLFHQRAVAGTGWTPSGGAALTTFFVGACVAVFPGVFRAWQRGRHRWNGMSKVGIDELAEGDLQLHDPADQVVSRERVVAELKRMDPKVREIAEQIVWHGRSHDEIAAELGVTARSVEARLYRFRAERRRRQGEGRDE